MGNELTNKKLISYLNLRMATSHVTDFIQSLNPEELKFIKKHISSENKMKQLLEILTDEPDKKFSDQELAKLVGNSYESFRVLKSRLFDKVKEILLFDEHFENQRVFNERETLIFILKKKMLFAKFISRKLNQKRKTTYAIMLSEIIEIGKKNQAFDILVEALILQKQLIGLRNGISEFEKINDLIIFYDKCFKAVQNANDNYYRLIINQNLINSFAKRELEQHICNAIETMQSDYNFTKSAEINYYIHLLKMALYESKKDFNSAIEYCKKILLLIKGNKNLYSNDRMGFVMGNLCIFNIYIHNYKHANSFATKGQQFHIPNSLASLILKEQEFYSLFYSCNYIKANDCISEMLKHSSIDTGEFFKSKFVYFKAMVLFLTNQFREALKLLNESLEIEKDKTGWNIGLRVLLIMIYIALFKNNEASTSIASLRKHQERMSKTKGIKERDVLIFKLLRELEKDGFKRNEKNKKATKLITGLADKDKPTSWNHFTPELIPFHEWVMTLPTKN